MFYSVPDTSKTKPTDSIYKAVKAYIELCSPDVEKKNVICGNQNRIALPSGTNEYCVFNAFQTIEHGTPVVRQFFNQETGGYGSRVERIVEVVVRIDSYSDDVLKAQERAQTMSMASRSVVGGDFFQQFGIAVLNADMPTNTTVVMDEEQYIQRFSFNLHLMYTHSAEFNSSYFTSVKANLKEIDSSFPPTEEN